MVSGDGTAVDFLEGVPTLSNVYDKFSEITESRKPKGNTGKPFGLKSFCLVWISEISF